MATLPDSGPPHFRAGPWIVDRLKPCEPDEREVYGFYASVVLADAKWTDTDGAYELSWPIDVRDPSMQPSRNRRAR